MTGPKRQAVIWATLALFAISWSGTVVACWADDGPTNNPGDPESYPSTSRVGGSTADAFQCAEETLEPTPGILSSFWMILMAMAFQLAL
jgi:hypothetical protein